MLTKSMKSKQYQSLPIALGSPERFGYSWDRYAQILPEHEEQFRRWTTPMKPEDWRGKRFVDAGCGIGRNSYWPMIYGATGALAVDVDERTLGRAKANLALFSGVEVRNQSIYDISEQDEFDIALSIGVVHHLQFPEEAVARLARAVKPGGRVHVWLYGRENNGWIVWFADPVRRALFSWLPLRMVHSMSWPATAALWVALRVGLQRIEYFRLIRRFSFDHLRAIVFDHMIPKIARYYTREQAITLLEEAGLTDVDAVWVNEISWAVSGRKPAQASKNTSTELRGPDAPGMS
jgi:SAM-dependent methyltransferase